jgi:3-methyladenine DNA glycosylase AlkD
MRPNDYRTTLVQQLKQVSTVEKAASARRYFPSGINCLGANAGDIKLIITHFYQSNPQCTPELALAITETLLLNAQYNEEKLLAFGLINKFVRKHYDDELFHRFEYWLENYANNWAQVDDLCIKTIYQFLMARPHLIEKTERWAYSNCSWCRRASNVVWVKFIKRNIRGDIYSLDTRLVFKNCDLLLHDNDEFVQKSIGWLLKVTSVHHESAVIDYLQVNITHMTRSTVRYAIEKMNADTRHQILSLTKK